MLNIKNLRLLLIILCTGLLSFQSLANSDKLNAIIAKYEAKRDYDFKWNASVKNTIKYYQSEADFSKQLKEKLKLVSEVGLSESEKISKELLLFVLQDKIDANTYKTYLNSITNESAFYLNLSQMRNTTFKNEKQVKAYLKELDNTSQYINYSLKILRTSVKEGMVQPRVVFNNYEDTYNKYIVSDVTTSEFYKPFLFLPESFSSALKNE